VLETIRESQTTGGRRKHSVKRGKERDQPEPDDLHTYGNPMELKKTREIQTCKIKPETVALPRLKKINAGNMKPKAKKKKKKKLNEVLDRPKFPEKIAGK